MNPNTEKTSLRQRLKDGKAVVGTWLQSGSAVAAEIMALYGFDFIAADMEHGDVGMKAFYDAARAVGEKSRMFARVQSNDVMSIRKVLDAGASGVIVPLVNNAEQAKNAVRASKYPPLGIRGFAFVRANGWGKDFDNYAKSANDDVLLAVMIETKQAVENIDEILEVDGVDAVLIGPYDLSGSYGVTGKLDNPEVLHGMEKVLEACKRHGVAAGQHIVNPNETNVKRALEQGYTFLALGMDTVFIADGAKAASSYASLAQSGNKG